MLPLFKGREEAGEAYAGLIPLLESLGGYVVEEKKTSLHITNGKVAFLGVHPRKNGIRLNIVLARALEGSRVAKTERVSANRFHNEVDLVAGAPLDEELSGWIREAYARLQDK